jgi:DNA-directed RNA polymerase specialized sigma24 family protein
LLSSAREVVTCLVTYNDWWQPPTASVLKVGAARLDKTIGDGLRPGLLETIEERTELCRRVDQLRDEDRRLLFHWYVMQLHVDDVADILGISRRQCFRRKSRAIQKIIDLGMADQAA